MDTGAGEGTPSAAVCAAQKSYEGGFRWEMDFHKRLLALRREVEKLAESLERLHDSWPI